MSYLSIKFPGQCLKSFRSNWHRSSIYLRPKNNPPFFKSSRLLPHKSNNFFCGFYFSRYFIWIGGAAVWHYLLFFKKNLTFETQNSRKWCNPTYHPPFWKITRLCTLSLTHIPKETGCRFLLLPIRHRWRHHRNVTSFLVTSKNFLIHITTLSPLKNYFGRFLSTWETSDNCLQKCLHL